MLPIEKTEDPQIHFQNHNKFSNVPKVRPDKQETVVENPPGVDISDRFL
jgi:hypothetical protein